MILRILANRFRGEKGRLHGLGRLKIHSFIHLYWLYLSTTTSPNSPMSLPTSYPLSFLFSLIICPAQSNECCPYAHGAVVISWGMRNLFRRISKGQLHFLLQQPSSASSSSVEVGLLRLFPTYSGVWLVWCYVVFFRQSQLLWVDAHFQFYYLNQQKSKGSSDSNFATMDPHNCTIHRVEEKMVLLFGS